MRLNNNNFQRNANISIIARTLWENPGISRIEMARKVGLYKSTVTNITATLIANGIVRETESKESGQAGRRPIGLILDETLGCFLGVEIQPGWFRAVVIDINGTILASRREDFPSRAGGIIDKFLGIMEGLAPALAGLGRPLLGIVVGIPGFVDPDNGIIIRSAAHDLAGFDFYGAIEGRFGVPVIIENDANCCAWGEFLEFRSLDLRNFICLLGEHHESGTPGMAGVGIGLGIVIDRKVYYGSSYASGEFKSALWNPARPSAAAGEHGGPGIGVRDAVGSPGAPSGASGYERLIEDIFGNLSVVVSVLNPSHLFIGGDFARDREAILATIDGKLPGRFGHARENGCTLEFSDLADSLVAFGAASMFVQKLLAIPELSGLATTYNIDWNDIFALVRQDPGALSWLRR